MAFLFGSNCKMAVELEEGERKSLEVERDGKVVQIPLYIGNETVKGTVKVTMNKAKKTEHQGIQVEFYGLIEMYYDRNGAKKFTTQTIELAPAGALMNSESFQFEFNKPEKPHESYNGIGVRLRYLVKATMVRSMAANTVATQEIWVHNYQRAPEVNSSIKMEVGIEDCLHIEFEYNRSKYHLSDVIIGKIFFLLVRIKIKHMELAIIKRETTGSGSNLYTESETITKYEIMDGAPVKGESIPIRLFLSPFDLTPKYRNVGGAFSVRYFLNLVLVDEDNRRYFKQQEIALWRKRSDRGEADKHGGHKSYQLYEREADRVKSGQADPNYETTSDGEEKEDAVDDKAVEDVEEPQTAASTQ